MIKVWFSGSVKDEGIEKDNEEDEEKRIEAVEDFNSDSNNCL